MQRDAAPPGAAPTTTAPPADGSLEAALQSIVDAIDEASTEDDYHALFQPVVDRLAAGADDEEIALLASVPALAGVIVQLLGAQDPSAGVEMANRLVAVAPTEPAFVQLVWEADVADGRIDEALRLAEDVRRQAPDESLGHLLAGDAHRMLGLLAREAGDAASAQASLEASRGSFTDAIASEPNDPRGWAGRARIAYLLRDFDAVVADTSAAIERGDQSADVFNLRGLAHEATGVLKPAKADYTKATKLAPTFADAWRNLGDARLALGETDGAVASYTQAVALEPESVTYRKLLARAHRAASRWQAVLEDLAPFGTTFGEDMESRGMRGEALTELGIAAPARRQRSLIDRAIAELDEALKLAPTSALILYYRARARYQIDDLPPAIADCDAAAVLTPDDPDVYFLRGLVRGRSATLAVISGDADAAAAIAVEGIRDFDRAYVFEPTKIRSPLYRGEIRALLGDWVGARADYTLAISLGPATAMAYAGRARCAANLDDPAAAVPDLDMAISLDENEIGAYLQRGLSRADLATRADEAGDGEAAKQLLDLALIDLDVAIERGAPESEAETRYYRGMARSMKARRMTGADAARPEFENSLEDLSRAVALAPDFGPARILLGQVFGLLERYDDALEAYSRAIELDADNIEALTGHGIIHEIREEYALALLDYERVAELAPDIPQAWQNVGDALVGLGMTAQAASAYTRWIELEPSGAKGYASRAAAQAADGDFEASIRDLDVAIELAPDDASLYVKRGNELTRIEEHERAVWDYDRALELSADEPEANLGRAFAYARLGEGLADRGEPASAAEQFALSIADARRAIEIADDDPWTHRYLGFGLRGRAAYDLAFDAFTDAADRAEDAQRLRAAVLADAADALRIWAHVTRDRPLIERAVEAFRAAIEVGGDDPSLAGGSVGFGEALIDLGDDAGAIEAFRHALRLDPGHRRAEVGIGTANLRLGRNRRARHWYGRASAEDSPVRDWARVGLAVALRRLGEQREARRLMRAVLRANGASGHVTRSGWLDDIGEREAAIDDARRAVVVAPESGEAHNQLSWLLSTSEPTGRRLTDAVHHGRRAVELAREPFERAGALDTYAWALVVAGELASAIEHLQESIALDEYDVFPRRHLEQATEALRLAQAAQG